MKNVMKRVQGDRQRPSRQRVRPAAVNWRSEEQFRLLVDSVVDYAIFMLDADGRVVSWNAGAERINGYRPEEILGQHFSTFYPATDIAQGKPEHELSVAKREGRFDDEGWRVRKDGSPFWASVVITTLFDHGGNVTGFAKITRDITQRPQREESLQHTAERFRLLVEAVKDYAIFMLDPEGYVRRGSQIARFCEDHPRLERSQARGKPRTE